MKTAIKILKNSKIAIAILALGILFICIGVYRGEAETVLIKAINVCLECIGIG